MKRTLLAGALTALFLLAASLLLLDMDLVRASCITALSCTLMLGLTVVLYGYVAFGEARGVVAAGMSPLPRAILIRRQVAEPLAARRLGRSLQLLSALLFLCGLALVALAAFGLSVLLTMWYL